MLNLNIYNIKITRTIINKIVFLEKKLPWILWKSSKLLRVLQKYITKLSFSKKQQLAWLPWVWENFI